jgi:general secretion pathway protein D
MNKKLPFSFALVACLLALAGCAALEDLNKKSSADKVSPQKAVEFGPVPAKSQAATASTASQPAPAKTEPKIFTGTGALVKQTPVTQPAAPGAEEVVLNFEGVDIRTVIETILATYLREPYVVNPQIAGTITFRTTRGIPKSDLIPTLEMLLRMNNAALVREDNMYKILPFAQVRGSVTPQLGGVATPLPNGFSIVVVPLKFMGAKAMTDILVPFTTDGSAVRADEVRNLIILAGGQRELKHLLETIDLFDVDFLSGMSVGLFPIKSADVKGLMADVDKVFGAAGNPLNGIVRIIPIERLNALLIVTPQPRYLEEAKKWIERLDQGTGAGGGLFVYQVKNGKAESLAGLLGEIFGGKSPSGPSAPQLAPGARPAEIRSPQSPGQPGQPAIPQVAQGFQATQIQGDGIVVSKDVRVVADKDNNALLIIASQSDYAKIEQALTKLDVVRRQVLVEVTVAEVTLTDELSFGIDWFINARAGTSNGLSNLTTGTLNISNALPATPSGTTTGFHGLQLINRLGGDIRGILTALGKDGRVQLLASPQIMVLDNEKAEIKVGDRISVQTQTQAVSGTATGLVNSFQYLDTGILLAVTPRINASGQVTLDVRQEFSVPSADTPVGANPNINTRSAQTSVIVNSGEAMVLGGLIQEKSSRSSEGLPLLSKIPVLGAAFGVQGIKKSRTELVIMITPRVVASTIQAQEVTNELRRKLPALEGLLPKAKGEAQGREPAGGKPALLAF